MLENQTPSSPRTTGAPLYVELPASVELEITYTEPGLQGDRSTGGTKPATLETGAEIQVPLFLETGTKVKVDTRDGSYLGRVNE
jgi:elongation factor P